MTRRVWTDDDDDGIVFAMSAALHPTLERWFTDYAAAHRHPMNRLTHKIAIPLIVFHIIAMLDWIKLPLEVAGVAVSVGHLVYLAAILFYLRLHLGLGLLMAVLMAACFPLAAITPGPVVIAVAVVGWLVQLAGHSVWEKNRPAFLTNLLQALIGPLFFVAVLTGVWRPVYAPAPETAAAE
jgi:uncharacterized membrane protein YGL010W